MTRQLSLTDRSWPVLGRLTRVHTALYRATGGRIGHRVPRAPRVLLLDHVGARTGTRRTTPLAYMPSGGSFVVVGSKSGHPNDPAWVHNLRTQPDTEIQVGPDRIRVRARQADAAERKRLWPEAVRYNPIWGRYQRRTQRVIPLIVLEPQRD
jgi:F420H(2)-dependent quinone reductase